VVKYIINEKAIEDINQIWMYTAENWSVEQADRYYNLILDEIEYIAENFKEARSFETIKQGYRTSKVKSHILFFKKTMDDQIEVIRVLHERMDLDNRLND
jgi:toxin ParE1/3/4